VPGGVRRVRARRIRPVTPKSFTGWPRARPTPNRTAPIDRRTLTRRCVQLSLSLRSEASKFALSAFGLQAPIGQAGRQLLPREEEEQLGEVSGTAYATRECVGNRPTGLLSRRYGQRARSYTLLRVGPGTPASSHHRFYRFHAAARFAQSVEPAVGQPNLWKHSGRLPASLVPRTPTGVCGGDLRHHGRQHQGRVLRHLPVPPRPSVRRSRQAAPPLTSNREPSPVARAPRRACWQHRKRARIGAPRQAGATGQGRGRHQGVAGPRAIRRPFKRRLVPVRNPKSGFKCIAERINCKRPPSDTIPAL
jgi:hypothetical protein